MELKSFKGMPHELGGIDYTEGAEVEGGEYAVKIGTLGNEYIFDKESPEGDFLAKEYKKLNRNDRLLEDDPIALATFDQIARDQALTHAQRSVNEKGIDPFRNMYDEGQAKNGGVKYATGGPIGHNMDESAEDRMRTTAFGDQQMRIESETINRKDIPAWKEAGLLMGDIFLTPVTSAFTGKSFSEMAMADSPYRSSEATRRAVGDDTMTGTAFGYGFAESEGVISNLGTQFFSKQGGALPKDKYAQGGVSGQKDMYMGGGAWMQLFEGIHNVRQGSKQIAGPAIDSMYEDQRYVRQPIAGPPTTTGGGSLGIPQKEPQEEQQGGLDPQYFDSQGNPWMMDEGQLTNMPVASESPDMITGDTPIDLGGSSAFGGDFGGFKSGGVKKGVYGYYANGGGRPEVSTDPGMIPVRTDNTCVEGVNCFEDLAGVEGIPSNIKNNVDLEAWYNSEEGRKMFEKVAAENAKPGDYVQFRKPASSFKRGASYLFKGGDPASTPSHLGVVSGDDIYIGDGYSDAPVGTSSLMRNQPTYEASFPFASYLNTLDTDYSGRKKADYYRLKDDAQRRAVLNAAMRAADDEIDIYRNIYEGESPTKYVSNPKYSSSRSYPSPYN